MDTRQGRCWEVDYDEVSVFGDKKKMWRPPHSHRFLFFNARGGYLEHSMIGMYRSLLVQLLKRFPDLQSVLDDTDIVPWSQQDCPELNALKELLRSAIIALDRR